MRRLSFGNMVSSIFAVVARSAGRQSPSGRRRQSRSGGRQSRSGRRRRSRSGRGTSVAKRRKQSRDGSLFRGTTELGCILKHFSPKRRREAKGKRGESASAPPTRRPTPRGRETSSSFSPASL